MMHSISLDGPIGGTCPLAKNRLAMRVPSTIALGVDRSKRSYIGLLRDQTGCTQYNGSRISGPRASRPVRPAADRNRSSLYLARRGRQRQIHSRTGPIQKSSKAIG
jgi:hypothetical protein